METQDNNIDATDEGQSAKVDAPKTTDAPLTKKDIDIAINGALSRWTKSQQKREAAVEKPKGVNAETQNGEPDGVLTPAELKELRELRAKMRHNDEERQKEVTARRAAERTSTLTNTLQKLGVDNIEGAIALLEYRKVVQQDEDGSLSYRRGRVKNADGEFDDDVSLEEGVKGWLATDEGKRYLPAKGSQGSGTKGGKKVQLDTETKKPTSDELIRRMIGKK